MAEVPMREQIRQLFQDSGGALHKATYDALLMLAEQIDRDSGRITTLRDLGGVGNDTRAIIALATRVVETLHAEYGALDSRVFYASEMLSDARQLLDDLMSDPTPTGKKLRSVTDDITPPPMPETRKAVDEAIKYRYTTPAERLRAHLERKEAEARSAALVAESDDATV